MKMKQEHFKHLEKAIDDFCTTYKELIPNHIESVISINEYKDLKKRIRWDIYWAASRINDRELLTFACDTFYKYLNDAHIDTALNKIMKKHDFYNQLEEK